MLAICCALSLSVSVCVSVGACGCVCLNVLSFVDQISTWQAICICFTFARVETEQQAKKRQEHMKE